MPNTAQLVKSDGAYFNINHGFTKLYKHPLSMPGHKVAFLSPADQDRLAVHVDSELARLERSLPEGYSFAHTGVSWPTSTDEYNSHWASPRLWLTVAVESPCGCEFEVGKGGKSFRAALRVVEAELGKRFRA